MAFGLRSVSPNPMRKEASFTFALPRGSQLKLEIVDLQGRRVATVADGNFKAGVHQVRWNGATSGGGPARAGVYFARLSAAGLAMSKSFIVIR
jgi:flagellar hook assembly protein FlgD